MSDLFADEPAVYVLPDEEQDDLLILMQKGLINVNLEFEKLKSVVDKAIIKDRVNQEKSLENPNNHLTTMFPTMEAFMRLDEKVKMCLNLREKVDSCFEKYREVRNMASAMESSMQSVYDKMTRLNNLVMETVYKRDNIEKRLSDLEKKFEQ